MASHANKTITSTPGALGATSIIPSGAVTLSSGITVIGSLTHGSIIQIVSDGSVNFGNEKPDLVCYTDLKNAGAAGTDFVVTEGVTVNSGYVIGNGVVSSGATPLKIRAAADFPNGKAFAIGDQVATLKGTQAGGNPTFGSPNVVTTGQLEAIATKRKSKQVFITYLTQWGALQQQNMMENSVENEQVKLFWFYSGSNGHGGGSLPSAEFPAAPDSNDYLNVYVGLPSGNGGGKFVAAPYTINSSTSVTLTISGNTTHAFVDSSDVGKTVVLSSLSSVGNAGNAVIASVSSNTVVLTVSGWPASGSGTLNILKRGVMQVFNHVLRANQAAYIANSNIHYLMTKEGTIADPYTIPNGTAWPTQQVSDLCIHQVWINSDSPNNWCWSRLINTVTGEIYNYLEIHPRVSTIAADRDKFDYMHFPGNVQGCEIDPIAGNPNSSVGKNQFTGDFVIQHGLAARRVELVNVSDNGPGITKLAHFPALYWSPFLILAVVIDGVFTGVSKTGMTLQVMSETNSRLAYKQV